MSDLELLNNALEGYREKKMAAASDALSKKRFSSEAEQMAAETEATRAANAPVTDLSELVRAGLIKALPTPPAGKKYVIDPKTQRAALVDAK